MAYWSPGLASLSDCVVVVSSLSLSISKVFLISSVISKETFFRKSLERYEVIVQIWDDTAR